LVGVNNELQVMPYGTIPGNSAAAPSDVAVPVRGLVASDTVSGQLCVASLDAISVGGVARDAFDRPVAFNQEEAKDGAKLKVGIFAAGATEDPLGIASGAITKISEVATITSGVVDVAQAVDSIMTVKIVDGSGSALNITNGALAAFLADSKDGKSVSVANGLVGTYLANSADNVPISVVETTVMGVTSGQLCTTTSLPDDAKTPSKFAVVQKAVRVYNTVPTVAGALLILSHTEKGAPLRAFIESRVGAADKLMSWIRHNADFEVVCDEPVSTFPARLQQYLWKLVPAKKTK